MGDDGLTVPDLLRRSARRNGAKAAIVMMREGVEVSTTSYEQLYEDVSALAENLLHLGLLRGDRVALVASNSYDFCRVGLACAAAGLTAAFLNVHLGPSDMKEVVAELRPGLVVGDQALLTLHEEAVRAGGFAGECLSIDAGLPVPGRPGSVVPEAAVSQGQQADVQIDPDEPCLILYTSGSTARPKGVVLSHRSLVMNAWSVAGSWGFRSEDRVLVGLPMYHVSMWDTTLFPTLLAGATAVIVDDYRTETIFERLHESRASIALALPYMLRRVVEESARSALGKPPLRLALYGMAGMPVDLAHQLRHDLGIAMMSGFGQTESGGNTLVLTDEHHELKCGSIGQPVPNADVELMDGRGQLLPPRCGEVGELVYRGPSVASGYFMGPGAIDPLGDPWLHSGDLAYEDEDGFFWFQGRTRDVIKSGGENVYAAKVEQVIAAIAGVLEVAVVGRPSDRWGEEVVAFVVPSPQTPPSREDILQRCRAQLARFEVPKSVELVEGLPKSSAGKVVKRRLVEEDWR
jgi:fatty-acyl-CoA synthase